MAIAKYNFGWNNVLNRFTEATSPPSTPIDFVYSSSPTFVSSGTSPDPNGEWRLELEGDFGNGLLDGFAYYLYGAFVYGVEGINGTIADGNTAAAEGGPYGATRYTFRLNDSIEGSNQKDVLVSGAGNDFLSGLDGDDQLDGEEGDDRILGGNGKDLLVGGFGNDRLEGGPDNDIFSGLQGRDLLIGGPGADRYAYFNPRHSPATSSRDVITSFQRGLDRIDVRLIDAIRGGSDNRFSFIGSRAFSAAGQIRYSNGIASFNTDRDSTAEMQILLRNRPAALSGADFIL